jgi:hypothetical protein
MLSSDEDEIDDEGQEYLEHLERKVNSNKGNAPFAISAQIQDVRVEWKHYWHQVSYELL